MNGWLPGWKANSQKHEDFVPEAALHSAIRISFKKSLTMAAGRARHEKNKLYILPNLPAAALTAGIALQGCAPETPSTVFQMAKQQEVSHAAVQTHQPNQLKKQPCIICSSLLSKMSFDPNSLEHGRGG